MIHGAAGGADTIIGMICEDLKIKTTEYPADWSKGRDAGFDRNIEMLDTEPDKVLAFHRGRSSGTAHTIRNAKSRGIPVEVVEWRG